MQCEEFENILMEQDDGPLPRLALAHIDDCEACRTLTADLNAIHDLGLEIGAEGVAPPERIWVSLRNQLEAERLIHDTHPAPIAIRFGWWTVLQRPAFAGAFLAVILIAAGAVSYRGANSALAFHPQFDLTQEATSDFSPGNAFQEESQTVGSDRIPGLPEQDATVTDSLRRNLGIVDNFIAVCEKSVREQPDNQMAREYLYGAYQQKAELLATAMNHSVTGGLQ